MSNLLDPETLKPLIMGFLNVGVIAGATTVQLPQIRNVISNKSSAGLSETMLILQTVSVSMSCLYPYLMNFPIMTWAENIFLVLQMGALVILSWYYGKGNRVRQAFISGAYLSFVTYALFGKAGSGFLTFIAVAPSPLIIFARIPQVTKNYSQGHTGTLSLMSLFMAVTGNTARVATTIAQVSDLAVLASHASALAINLTMLLQVIYYWKQTTIFLEQIKEKKED